MSTHAPAACGTAMHGMHLTRTTHTPARSLLGTPPPAPAAGHCLQAAGRRRRAAEAGACRDRAAAGPAGGACGAAAAGAAAWLLPPGWRPGARSHDGELAPSHAHAWMGAGGRRGRGHSLLPAPPGKSCLAHRAASRLPGLRCRPPRRRCRWRQTTSLWRCCTRMRTWWRVRWGGGGGGGEGGGGGGEHRRVGVRVGVAGERRGCPIPRLAAVCACGHAAWACMHACMRALSGGRPPGEPVAGGCRGRGGRGDVRQGGRRGNVCPACPRRTAVAQ